MAMMPNMSFCLSRAVRSGVDSGVVFLAGITVGVDNDWGDKATSGVMDAGAGCVAPLRTSNRCRI